MRIAIVLSVSLAVLIGVLLTDASPARPDAFRFTSSASINTLDPASMSWIEDLRLAGLLFEGLYATDPATLEPRPACAESVHVSDDRLEYTFTIRQSARWSNGDRVTADDFVFGWRRALEPGTASDYAFFFDEIEGVRDYVNWRWSEIERLGNLPTNDTLAIDEHWREADSRFERDVAIQAIDSATLRIRLRRPVAYLNDLLAFAVMYPLHQASVERFRVAGPAGLVYYNEQWAKPGNTYYNGAYHLTSWRFKRGLMLERNEHYWDVQRIHIPAVQYVDVSDANTAWLMYTTGHLDWLPSIDTSFAAALSAQSGSVMPGIVGVPQGTRRDIHPIPSFGTYYYNFNCNAKLADGSANPFHDPRVRRAFALATDRQSLVTHVTRRGEPPARTLVPPNVVPGYPEVDGLGFDPDAARAELARAGYPSGSAFPPVKLLYNTGGEHGLIAESISQMWRKNLGVETRLIGKEPRTFAEDKRNQLFMVCRASWFGDYLDPTTFLDTLRSDNGNNDSAYSDTRYDELLNAAERERDPAARMQRMADAERYLSTESMPVLPLFRFVHVSAVDPVRVRGLRLNPRLILSLKDVEIVPE